jgi:hypothetical protein
MGREGGSSLVATGQGTISSGSSASLTVELKDGNGAAWTGTGAFYIEFWVSVDSSEVDGSGNITTTSVTYLYTNGVMPNEDNSNVPRYTITSASTTIDFSKFPLAKWAEVLMPPSGGGEHGDNGVPSELVGTWESSSSPEMTMEFRSDGQFNCSFIDGDLTASVIENTVTISSYGYGYQVGTFDYEIYSNQMTIYNCVGLFDSIGGNVFTKQ